MATKFAPAPFAATVIFVMRNADGSIVRLSQDDTTAATLAGIVAANDVVTIECPTCGDEMSHCPSIRKLLGA
jgi:predicted RNA-binding Zn-ribbon protein involved in translation (DUF1610 family)